MLVTMVQGQIEIEPMAKKEKMQHKKVLIVAYAFPPRNASGSVRPMGLAKYLPQFGWEPLILTARLPGPPPEEVKVLETDYVDILSKVKALIGYRPEVGIQKQLGLSPGKNGNNSSSLSRLISSVKATISFPDEQVGWFKFAVEEGKRLLAKDDIDAIISTSPPSTAHLIARKLRIESGKPWVADFRDLWTQSHYYNYSGIRHFIERRLEVRTLSQADAIVTAHPLVDQLRQLHKSKPIYWIPNGFDPDSFPKSVLARENDKLIIAYFGNLYDGKRDPEPLFQALSGLITNGEIKRTDIEVRLFGPFEEWLLQDVRKYDLHDVVKIKGQVPREDVLRSQMGSSLLLILTWDNPQEASIYPGKVFEYLGAQRPILAIGGPGGVVKELLEKTQAGVHVSNLAQLKTALMEYYKAHQACGIIPYNPIKEEVERYTHEVMAQKFAKILDEISEFGN